MIESIKPKSSSLSATLSIINTKHASTVIKMTLGSGFTTKDFQLSISIYGAHPF